MFRPAISRTLLLRHATASTTSTAPLNLLLRNQPRLLSTSSASAKRSTFKGTVARWTLAGALIYWYSTSSVFTDDPKFHEDLPPAPSETDTDRPPSLLPTKPLRPPRSPGHDGEDATSGAEALEAEAGQEGAFNPETGEINWDCPCLGGMAHGPCGDEFKAAFSCFVFSTEEPKGVDCIEKFKGMQACFQRHPDVYGSELDGDDEDEDELDAPPPTTPDDTPLTAPDGTPLAAKPSPSPPSTATTPTPTPGSAAGQTPAATEAKTAPSLAEPSRSARDTPALQQAHRGDAGAGEDAPRRRKE